MKALPTGEVTFLFTDIEGSTRLLGQDPQGYARALLLHDELLTRAVTDHRGVVFETVGDAVYAAFKSPADGVRAAIQAQRDLMAADWGALGTLKVRMALHNGDVQIRGDHYFGAALYRCARLMAVGYGGQILLSRAVAEIVRAHLPSGSGLRPMGTHRLKDLSEAEEISQVIGPGLATEFPPLKSLDARPTNLPIQVTSFVGRESERAELRRLIRSGRLISLIGPGGAGKSRLAVQAATEVANAFDDGVCFVPLSTVTEPALVPAAIAAALDVRGAPGTPPSEIVEAHLKSRELLLVLDNFEQVVDAAPAVADLLASCPKVAVMATSRMPLGISGEQRYVVPPLALFSGGDAPNGARSDAVVLFAQRALAVNSDFRVDDASLATIAAICERLEGLPLAIELAAARSDVLSPQAMLTRLDDRLRLLSGGPRDRPSRHQSLQAAIAWSYDLLTEQQKSVFRRFSIFAGGATLEGAAAVLRNDELSVLEDLSALVSRSVLQQRAQRDGQPRFSILETIREFGLGRLRENGEAHEMRSSLTSYVADLGRRFQDGLLPVAAIDLEHANIRSVVRSDEPGSAAVSRRIVAALWPAWGLGAHSIETEEWVSGALAVCEGDPLRIRAELVMASGAFASIRGDPSAAQRLRDAIVLWRLEGDIARLGTCLSMLGLELIGSAQLDEASAAGDEALALARADGDWQTLKAALVNRAEVARYSGDDNLAIALNEESVHLGEIAGDDALDTAQSNLGVLYLRRGDVATARARLGEALATALRSRQPIRAALWLAAVAGLALAMRDPLRAVRSLACADSIFNTLKVEMWATDKRDFERYRDTARLALTAAEFEDAWTEGSRMTAEQAVTEAKVLFVDATRAADQAM